jgi:hypothetical protein
MLSARGFSIGKTSWLNVASESSPIRRKVETKKSEAAKCIAEEPPVADTHFRPVCDKNSLQREITACGRTEKL